MVQKQQRRATSRGCCSTGSLPTRGCTAVRRRPVYRSTLGRTARGQRLDRVVWTDQSHVPKRTGRTDLAVEQLVLQLRRWLKEKSVLGEYGAVAIARELEARSVQSRPSIRTIGRILQRHGVLDGRRRTRRPPPPRGWYLPEVAASKAELDSFDTIEGLAILGGPHLTVLTGISLHGGLPSAWTPGGQCQDGGGALVEHWRSVGLPRHAEFDNDNRFQGPRHYADVVGRVTRLCSEPWHGSRVRPTQRDRLSSSHRRLQRPMASEGLVAVRASLAPRPGQPFRQVHRGGAAAPCCPYRIGPSTTAVSQAVAAGPATASSGEDHLPATHQWPRPRQPHGHAFAVDRYWLHRFGSREVDLDAGKIRFYALRCRDPTDQHLLREVNTSSPGSHFRSDLNPVTLAIVTSA